MESKPKRKEVFKSQIWDNFEWAESFSRQNWSGRLLEASSKKGIQKKFGFRFIGCRNTFKLDGSLIQKTIEGKLTKLPAWDSIASFVL